MELGRVSRYTSRNRERTNNKVETLGRKKKQRKAKRMLSQPVSAITESHKTEKRGITWEGPISIRYKSAKEVEEDFKI